MRISLSATFSTPQETIWEEARRRLSGNKEMEELRDAFDFLHIWQDYLRSLYGELESVTHLSNPDDPPDVIAYFERGELNIELTSLEPDHIHQSEQLKGQFSATGHTVLPISYKPSSRAEAETIMATPGHQQAWENVSDRCFTRKEIIMSRVLAKLQNSGVQALAPGVILLTGDLMGDPNEEVALRSAFEELALLPQASGWQFGTVHHWNDSSFYSTLYRVRDGFRVMK
jgi:hypothetical protein